MRTLLAILALTVLVFTAAATAQAAQLAPARALLENDNAGPEQVHYRRRHRRHYRHYYSPYYGNYYQPHYYGYRHYGYRHYGYRHYGYRRHHFGPSITLHFGPRYRHW